MNKLIKLSDIHYIIVDDSEKKIGDWIIDIKNIKFPRQIKTNHLLEDLYKSEKKITHSTQPIEYKYDSQKQGFNMGVMSSDVELIFNEIKPLSLSEVEEAVYGYNYHTLAKEACIKYGIEIDFVQPYTLFIEGFKAHQELVKDKLFTVEDLYVAFSCGRTYEKSNHHSVGQNELVDYIKSLKKTEWDIEFDEQGKIKLI